MDVEVNHWDSICRLSLRTSICIFVGISGAEKEASLPLGLSGLVHRCKVLSSALVLTAIIQKKCGRIFHVLILNSFLQRLTVRAHSRDIEVSGQYVLL